MFSASNASLLFDTVEGRLRLAAERRPDKEAVVFSHHGIHKTYQQLYHDKMKLGMRENVASLKGTCRVTEITLTHSDLAATYVGRFYCGLLRQRSRREAK